MFEQLWPWPGVVLLVLLAAWFFYMGAMADVDDISTAFLGLGGVTSLVALLALRAANLGGMRALGGRDTAARVAPPEADDDDYDDDELEETPQLRAPITAESGETEQAGDIYGGGETANEPIPLRPPARSDAEEDNAPRAARRRERLARLEDAAAASDTRRTFNDVSEVAEAIQHLEVMINREKAERGAALARMSSGRSDGEPSGEGRELSVALEERLNNFLTIHAFNAAMNQKVFPQIGNMIRKALRDQIDPEALMERIGTVGENVDPETSVTLALQLAEARQALEAHVEEAQKDRKTLREEIRAVRKRADEALSQLAEAGGAPRDGGQAPALADESGLSARIEEIASATEARIAEIASATEARIAEIAAAVARLDTGLPAAAQDGASAGEGAPGDADAMQRVVQTVRGELAQAREAMERQFGEIEAKLAEASGAAEAVTARVEATELAHRRLARRLNELINAQQEAQPAAAPAPATAPAEAEKSEVEALRDALSTIIEQNRAIRAQQDILSAHFDPAIQVGVDNPSKKG